MTVEIVLGQDQVFFSSYEIVQIFQNVAVLVQPSLPLIEFLHHSQDYPTIYIEFQ